MLGRESANLGVVSVPAGIMVENPAAALMTGQFAKEADFFSIGTNDLTQYTLAMDRGHPKLAPHMDGLNPAVLRLIAYSVNGARTGGRSIPFITPSSGSPQSPSSSCRARLLIF